MEFDDHAEIVQPPFSESLRTLLKIPAWWANVFSVLPFGSFCFLRFLSVSNKVSHNARSYF